ncbi:MAG: LLM class F420-dependent oxidoreductase, partial [Acidimicrobiia bacterium]|nr:LLM class F420-dependent oxidoreductase [Acidimicrobiia bacterium]
KNRTLRTVARFADQWDMTFPETPADWKELDGILRSHCEAVGRDEAEIARSVHLALEPDVDLKQQTARAQTFLDAGVDIIVWSFRGLVDPARLEPLADALTSD